MKAKRIISLLLTMLLAAGILIPAQAETAGVTYYNNGELSAEEPYVMYDEASGYYYAYTLNGGRNYRFGVKRSADMVTWEHAGGVLAKGDDGWGSDWYSSPEVYHNELTGKYYMFYSARVKSGTALCEQYFGEKYYAEGCKIGVAVSDSPEGPFTNISSAPLEYYPYDSAYYDIDKEMSSAIKPPPAQSTTAPQGVYISSSYPHLLFDTDGRIYMYFTRDTYRNWVWNSSSSKYVKESSIYCVELKTDWWTSTDGTTMPEIADAYVNENKAETDTSSSRKDGYDVILTSVSQFQSWEGAGSSGLPYESRELENPQVIKNSDKYYLFYTCSGKNSDNSAVGYAVLPSPTGAGVKYGQNPILCSVNGISAPGYGSITLSPDGTEYFCNYTAKLDGLGSLRLMNGRITFGGTDAGTGAPLVSVSNSTGDQAVPSGTAPFTIKLSDSVSSLEPDGTQEISYEIESAAGGIIAKNSKSHLVMASIANENVAEIVSLSPGSVEIKGLAVGKTTLTLKYMKRLSNGTNSNAVSEMDIPINVSGVTVSEITGDIYAGDDFSFSVTTDTDVTSIKLYNENNGEVTIKSLTSETVNGAKVWTVTTAVETEGIGRTLSIYAKTDGSFYDTYANIVFNVLPHLPKVLSMEFSADTAVVNEYVDVTIVTNSHAEIIRIANENGLNMGKTLISKTILENGNIQNDERPCRMIQTAAWSFPCLKL